MSKSSTFLSTNGDGYELNMGRWSRRLAQPFLAFTGLANNEHILDVGCGTGQLALAIAAHPSATAATVYGVDYSPIYVDYARKRSTNPQLHFAAGDACALGLPSGRFDRALSMLVLHFVPHAQQAIAEMRRVTKPGGVVAATVWDSRGGAVANRMFFDTAAMVDPSGAKRRASNFTRPMTRPGELAAAFHATGLQNVTETVLAIRMEFTSFADYWAPYLGKDGSIADYVNSLEPATRDQLREAVKAAYLDGEADGPRSYAALAWAAKGIVPG